MKKKLLSAVLAAVMILSVTACGKGKTAKIEGMKDGKFIQTRHITVELYDRNVDGGTEAGNNAWTKWVQQQMLDKYNIDVQYKTVARWTEKDDINNLLAAQTAPDICYTYDYPTIQTYAEMGGVHDLAPYLEKYKSLMPNMFAWLGDSLIYQDQDPATKTLWAIEGKRNETCRINTFVRKDWLDKLGLKEPTTVDEFESMLVAFRDNASTLLGADASKMVPFSISFDVGWRAANLIESFMDPAITDKELYVRGFDDRKFTQNGTKEAVKILNKWYNDGLIWKDFALYSEGDSTEDDMIKAGFVGAFMHNYDYPFRNAKDSINATLAAQYGKDAKFVAVNCFKDKNGKYTKYRYSEGGDRKVFFPKTNKEVEASLMYLEFMSDPATVEYLQIGDEGVIHHVDAATGAIVIDKPDDAHHDWFQNSGKNIDMTINCNGLRLKDANLTTLSLAYSYSDVDPADVKQAIEAAMLDSRAPKTPTVGDIAAETQGTDLKGKRDQGFDKAVTASVADFDSVWDAAMKEYLNAGGQAIIDERTAAWEAAYGKETMLK